MTCQEEYFENILNLAIDNKMSAKETGNKDNIIKSKVNKIMTEKTTNVINVCKKLEIRKTDRRDETTPEMVRNLKEQCIETLETLFNKV